MSLEAVAVLENKILENLKLNDITLDGKFILAISGGVDSMVLLDLFHKKTQILLVAHVNHGLRPEESAKEEALVSGYCSARNIPFETKNLHGAHSNENIQVWARRERYAWFRSLLSIHKMDYIVTAHHLDDNIETVLFNLIRGTGLKGVTGMSFLSNKILRPLIDVPKSDLYTYSDEHNIPFLEDSSNNKLKYSRNSIRKKLLPEISKLFPNYRERVSTTINNINSDAQLLDELIHKFSVNIISEGSSGLEIDKTKLLSLNNAAPYLFKLIQPYGFTYDQADKLILTAQNKSKQFLSQSHTILIEADHFLLKCNNTETLDYQENIKIHSSDLPLKLTLNNVDYSLEVKDVKTSEIGQAIATLDVSKLNFPLTIRRWKPGDYFYPLGMKGQKKKLKDFLKDLKLTSSKKQMVNLIYSDQDVVFVVPYRISENHKIDKNTSKVLVINLD